MINKASKQSLQQCVINDTPIISGEKALLQLPQELTKRNMQRVFIVVSKSVRKTKHYQTFYKLLKNDGKEVYEYFSITSNPKVEEIEVGAKIAIDWKPDCLIAIGGGSVMDATKAISIVVETQKPIIDYIHSNPRKRDVIKCRPYICVPTTVGTGSEVSHTIVITSKKGKQRIIENQLQSIVVILDPLLVQTLPKNILKATTIDAIAHAIEGYTSKYWFTTKDKEIESYALKAVSLLISTIRPALLLPTSNNHLLNLQWGALYAGLCLKHDLNACHYLAGILNTQYPNLLHGEAVALVLPSILKFNESLCSKNYRSIENNLYNNTGCSRNLVLEIEMIISMLNIHVTKQSQEIKREILSNININIVNQLNPKEMNLSKIDTLINEWLS